MNLIIYALYIVIMATLPSHGIENIKIFNETLINQDLALYETVCCKRRYSRETDNNMNVPKCTNGCLSEKCSCDCGYEPGSKIKTNYITVCELECQKNASCTSPSICSCKNDNKLNDTTNEMWEPVCRDQVENSRCIKPPNEWTCIENYQHDLRIDKCVMEFCLCNSNGYCLKREDECLCYDGYTKNVSTGQCEPQCQILCQNSICVANNICECLDGHHKTLVEHVCEQNDICNGHPCMNGECLITGECKCNSGYTKSLSYSGQFQCDVIQTFIGKVMTLVLGVPVLLLSCATIIIYALTKNKTYEIGEQEICLTNRM